MSVGRCVEFDYMQVHVVMQLVPGSGGVWRIYGIVGRGYRHIFYAESEKSGRAMAKKNIDLEARVEKSERLEVKSYAAV